MKPEPLTAGDILLMLGVIFLYFLPSWLGYKKRNRWSIFALNLFLGWTVIGWIAALIWALSVDRE